MKTTSTFSVEASIYNSFLSACTSQQKDRNRVIEQMMRDYAKVPDVKAAEIIVCPACGGRYSELLGRCPTCELNRIENEQKSAKIEAAKGWVKI